MYAIADPVFPEDPVGIPEPFRPRHSLLPEPFFDVHKMVPEDYEQRLPMRNTFVAWTGDDQDM